MDKVNEKLLNNALEKYSKREVSLGRAAEIAKIPITDFMRIAAKRKISINYKKENLEKDFEAAERDK